MRFFFLCAMVVGTANALSVAQLKAKVLHENNVGQQSQFAVGDFEDGDEIVLTVAKKGQPVPLPQFLQKASWLEVVDSSSPLKVEGFDYWTPQKDGFLFRNKDDTKRIMCVNKQTNSVDDDKVEMRFTCESLKQDDARFKVLPYSYANSPPSFWMPATNGCPYGNSNNWNTWNYAYYGVTPMGYWGCSAISMGSCASIPYYYPYMY